MKLRKSLSTHLNFRTKLIFASSILVALLGGVIFVYFNLGVSSKARATSTNISGVINSYGRVTNIDVAAKEFTIDNISGSDSDFGVGKKILIIQMKGVTINTSNTSSYGTITAYGDAGVYEFATVTAKTGAGPYVITLNQIVRSYNTSGYVQVVSVPWYDNAVVTGNITATPWDRTLGRGGVITMEVQNALTLQANISANGAGFKGGVPNTIADGGNANSSTYVNDNSASPYNGQKGEGVADYQSATMQFGRGPLGNGGGGGNVHNAGGGGGGNFTSGGQGGMSWNGAGTGGNGMGGYGLFYNSLANQIYMGGGGGASQQNNNFATDGASGGGIIIIRAATLVVATTHSITSNGNSAANSVGNDGAGGGGAGGTIFLDVQTYSLTADLNVNVHGGNGGSVGNSTQHGGGGGGGIGAVLFSHLPVNSFLKVVRTEGTAGLDCNVSCTASGAPGNPCITECPGSPSWSVAGEPTTLPVELLFFSGRMQERFIELAWITQEELNNDFFTLERSRDGKSFEILGKIEGNENRHSKKNYTYLDEAPTKGLNYYRLKQTDLNGQSKYLSTISIANTWEERNLSLISTSPNPFITDLRIAYELKEPGAVQIKLRNSSGNLIFEESMQGVKGRNEYLFTANKDLQQGIYIFQFKALGEGPLNVKVVKN